MEKQTNIKLNKTELIAVYWYDEGETLIYTLETLKIELIEHLKYHPTGDDDELLIIKIKEMNNLKELEKLICLEEYDEIFDVNLSDIYTIGGTE